MIIPVNELASDTLRNLVESYVLREGTDYGEIEASFEDKVNEVMVALKSGEAVLVYSELHDSVNIRRNEDYAAGEEESPL